MKKALCVSATLLLLGGVLFGCPSSTPVIPTITSLAINHGDASTINSVVTLINVCTETPTFYMASESGAFTGASWQTYSTTPTFTFSSTNGTKTVYFKVKNAAGESPVVNDTITLNNEIVATEETFLLPGDVPMVMVWCPAGTFMMGRYPGEQDSFSYESPRHQVTLTQGFWMGKYEVTQAQWLTLMQTNPSLFTDNPNRPVDRVTWDQAQTFVAALNTLEQGTFRLPTEAEWEYACRADTTTRFYWGDDLEFTQVENYTWYQSNSAMTTHPVGLKPPNAFGLYDMSGNVSEWCQDYYGSYTSAAVTDPTGPTSGQGRVFRGGAWYSDMYPRSASRQYGAAAGLESDSGIRVVKNEVIPK